MYLEARSHLNPPEASMLQNIFQFSGVLIYVAGFISTRHRLRNREDIPRLV
jgi:hypothetical protein